MPAGTSHLIRLVGNSCLFSLFFLAFVIASAHSSTRFAPPNDPILQALDNALLAADKDTFNQIYLQNFVPTIDENGISSHPYAHEFFLIRALFLFVHETGKSFAGWGQNELALAYKMNRSALLHAPLPYDRNYSARSKLVMWLLWQQDIFLYEDACLMTSYHCEIPRRGDSVSAQVLQDFTGIRARGGMNDVPDDKTQEAEIIRNDDIAQRKMIRQQWARESSDAAYAQILSASRERATTAWIGSERQRYIDRHNRELEKERSNKISLMIIGASCIFLLITYFITSWIYSEIKQRYQLLKLKQTQALDERQRLDRLRAEVSAQIEAGLKQEVQEREQALQEERKRQGEAAARNRRMQLRREKEATERDIAERLARLGRSEPPRPERSPPARITDEFDASEIRRAIEDQRRRLKHEQEEWEAQKVRVVPAQGHAEPPRPSVQIVQVQYRLGDKIRIAASVLATIFGFFGLIFSIYAWYTDMWANIAIELIKSPGSIWSILMKII